MAISMAGPPLNDKEPANLSAEPQLKAWPGTGICSACLEPHPIDELIRVGAYLYCIDSLERRTILEGPGGIVVELIG